MTTETQPVRTEHTLAKVAVVRARPDAIIWFTRLLQVVLGCALIAVAARAQVLTADWPVPVTLQTLVILVISAFYGPVMAVATVTSYVAIGLAGAPVFATAPFATLEVLRGPGGGYLVGFVLAAAFVGAAAARGLTRRVLPGVVVMFAGTLFILIPGAIWVAITQDVHAALAGAFLKFLWTGAIKSVLAALIVSAACRSLARDDQTSA